MDLKLSKLIAHDARLCPGMSLGAASEFGQDFVETLQKAYKTSKVPSDVVLDSVMLQAPG